MLKKPDAFRTHPYERIAKDPREFWKYMMNEGIMHFLTDTYDEMIDEIEIENSRETNLADAFSIIKTALLKIRQIFDILERDFRVKKALLKLEVNNFIMF